MENTNVQRARDVLRETPTAKYVAWGNEVTAYEDQKWNPIFHIDEYRIYFEHGRLSNFSLPTGKIYFEVSGNMLIIHYSTNKGIKRKFSLAKFDDRESMITWLNMVKHKFSIPYQE